jgi:hypothetical protein
MLLTRRQAVQLLIAGATSAVLTPRCVRAVSFPTVFGCRLREGELSALEAYTTGLSALDEDIIDTTGDKERDAALGKALVRLSQTFNVRPCFGFIDDGGKPNAYASRETKVPGTWGTVIFGQTLFGRLLPRGQGIAVLMVAAHEFGHIAQFRSNTDRRLLAGQRTVKRVELHADFLAGYFLGLRKRSNPTLRVREAGLTVYEIGDLQFNDRNHHGTPDERVAAAEEGYKFGSDGSSFDQAFSTGVEYIMDRYA